MAEKVILIHPPAISKRYMKTKFLPYGMAIIYAFLKSRNIPVLQYDFLMEYLYASPEDINFHNPQKTFTEKDYFSYLNGKTHHKELHSFTEKYSKKIDSKGKIYCFSIIAYPQFWATLLIGRYIKKINPKALIVFGGPFITIKPAEFFTFYEIAHCWIKGNGELPLLKIYEACRNGKINKKNEIPGIIYLKDGKIIANPPAETKAEEEKKPDFSGIPLKNYYYDNNIFIPYRITKGCSSKCSFCTGRLVDKYDVKSVKKIIEELKTLSQIHKTNSFMFTDASINSNPSLLKNLCKELIKELPCIRWYSYARVKGFDEELLELCKRAGCFSLSWGIESLSPGIINLLNKNYNHKKLYKLLDKSIELGIKNYIHLMYHTPYETEEDIKLLIEFIKKYIKSDRVIFSPMRFYLEPQSLMHINPSHYGLKNLRKIKRTVFDREHYLFDEINGLAGEAILKRSKKHEELLSPYLKEIASIIPETLNQIL